MTEQPLTRELGFWTVVALVMGSMIGSGVFLLPASLAPFGGGISLLGWVVSAGGSVLLALVFARLARLHPVPGGPFAYTRLAFGDVPAFLVTWSYWISIWSSLAALAVAFVGYLDPFLPGIVRSPTSAATLAVSMIWLLVGVNVWGLRPAGLLQVATTVLKVLPLALVGIAGLFVFEPSRFGVAPATAAEVGGNLMSVVTLTLFAFLGLEVGTIPAGRVIDPARTIPRATIVGTVLAAGVYMVSTVGVMSVVPQDELARSTAPFADAARVLFGDVAARLVAIGAAISCFGALNGWTLLSGQMPHAAAADRLFPRPFARLTASGLPATAMIIAGILASALVIMNSSRHLVDLFTLMMLMSTLGTLVPYLFCSMAAIVLRGRERATAGEPAGRAPTVIAAAAFAYAMVAVGGAGMEVVYWGFLLLLAGLPVYVWIVRGDPSTHTRT